LKLLSRTSVLPLDCCCYHCNK